MHPIISKRSAQKICEDLAAGKTIRELAKSHRLTRQQFTAFMKRYYGEQYEQALRARIEKYSDDLDEAVNAAIACAYDDTDDPVRIKMKLEARKIEIDTKKWMLARLHPRFRDKTEVMGAGGEPLIKAMKADDADYLSRMAAVEKQVDGEAGSHGWQKAD